MKINNCVKHDFLVNALNSKADIVAYDSFFD